MMDLCYNLTHTHTLSHPIIDKHPPITLTQADEQCDHFSHRNKQICKTVKRVWTYYKSLLKSARWRQHYPSEAGRTFLFDGLQQKHSANHKTATTLQAVDSCEHCNECRPAGQSQLLASLAARMNHSSCEYCVFDSQPVMPRPWSKLIRQSGPA